MNTSCSSCTVPDGFHSSAVSVCGATFASAAVLGIFSQDALVAAGGTGEHVAADMSRHSRVVSLRVSVGVNSLQKWNHLVVLTLVLSQFASYTRIVSLRFSAST